MERFYFTYVIHIMQVLTDVNFEDFCDDPAGRHLGRGGPTNPPQKEQCRKVVRTVLRTGPGVQRPEAPTTNR